MEAPTNGKKLSIVLLTIILTVLLSYTIYTKFFIKEGFDLFGMFAILFKFIIKLGDFLCWLGDAVEWCVNSVAALMYYVANIFSGCILFYIFDIIAGTVWYLMFIVASVFRQGDNYVKASGQFNDWRNQFDSYFFNATGQKLLAYSKETNKKCYKMKFDPFPKWPF